MEAAKRLVFGSFWNDMQLQYSVDGNVVYGKLADNLSVYKNNKK